jgi:hypothetical protein
MSYGSSNDSSSINDIGGGYSGQGIPAQQNGRKGVDGIRSIEDIQKARNDELNALGNGPRSGPPSSSNGSKYPMNVVPQDIINKMIPDIQNAAQDGSLMLPSRDIPHSQSSFTTDHHIQQERQVHFAPNNTKYIYETESDHPDSRPTLKDANMWFDELFIPVMAGILFYAVTCPRGIELSQQLIPSIFKSDGSMRQNGPMVLAICFTGVLYFGIKSHEYFSK